MRSLYNEWWSERGRCLAHGMYAALPEFWRAKRYMRDVWFPEPDLRGIQEHGDWD